MPLLPQLPMPLLSLLSKPWVIACLIAFAFIYALSNSIVKVEALRHPLVSSDKTEHKNKAYKRIEYGPTGLTKSVTTIDDTGIVATKTDEKAQPLASASIGGLWLDAGYRPLSQQYTLSTDATLWFLKAGLEVPATTDLERLKNELTVRAGLRVLEFH